MSSKYIKDHYGEFVETARREPVIHTSYGRDVLVTRAIDPDHNRPLLPTELPPGKRRSTLDYIGAGRRYSVYKDADDVIRSIRDLRGDDP